MRPPRPERASTRRDNGVKVIRTNEVRYPGADLPPLPADLQARYRAQAEAEGERLAPARDTGLAIEGRLARQQRARQRSHKQALLAGALALSGLLLVGIGWRATSDRKAPTAPLGGGATAAVASRSAFGFLGGNATSDRSAAPVVPASNSTPATAGPTPYFARYKKLKLRLPVPAKKLTEVGFHQASYGYALPMATSLPSADLGKAGNHQGTHRKISLQPVGPDAVLVGKVLRMWRARPGRPNTAADVGARPGTRVVAPVTGTVVKVKRYKLYGKWDDFEIHIQPDGYARLDVVMIHITNVVCAPGDRVVGGESRIGSIRRLSDKFYDQLASYTKDGGNHVHLQVNDATDPTYKGLEGAIDPSAHRSTPPTQPTLTPPADVR